MAVSKDNGARAAVQRFFESGHLYEWEDSSNSGVAPPLDAWDYFLAFLWIEGFKVVPIDDK